MKFSVVLQCVVVKCVRAVFKAASPHYFYYMITFAFLFNDRDILVSSYLYF